MANVWLQFQGGVLGLTLFSFSLQGEVKTALDGL